MPIALANYQLNGESQVRAGIVNGDRIIDLASLDQGRRLRTLADVYADWTAFEPVLATLPLDQAEGTPLTAVRLLPPSLEPATIYFAGFNYHDHVANMEKATGMAVGNDPKGLGLKPWHNLKPRSALCGHGSQVELPSDRVDWEVELAVIIGKRARRVPVADALSYVAGYTVAIDLSARDLGLRPHTPMESPARLDWIMQKGMEGFCPLGPWLTPRSAIADPQNLDIMLSVNGVLKQNSNTREMIYSVAEAIAHLSDMGTLSAGDVILTGTPAGVGAETGEFLKPGDVVTASIEAIGELRVELIPWTAPRFY